MGGVLRERRGERSRRGDRERGLRLGLRDLLLKLTDLRLRSPPLLDGDTDPLLELE